MFGLGKQRDSARMAQVIQGRLDAIAQLPAPPAPQPDEPGTEDIADLEPAFEAVKAG
jgi:hypothetical protein